MKSKVSLAEVYAREEDNVVAREIQGEFILVPIVSGIGDMEDEIFSLNETGVAVWKKLDGKKTLKEIAESLSGQYKGALKEIEADVLGIVGELVKRKMLSEVKKH